MNEKPKSAVLPVGFENPHTILDSFESLRRHHLAKQKIREQQLSLIHVKPHARILDVGIGPGLYLDFWLRHTEATRAMFTLVDASDSALRACEEVAVKAGARNRIQTLKSDLFHLKDHELGQFDIIFIGNTIEYIADPVGYIQSNVIPHLTPGGILAIRDMDLGIMNVSPTDAALCSHVIYSRIEGCRFNSKSPETYHDPFLGRDLHMIIRKAGLKEIQLYPFYCEFRSPLTDAAKSYLSKLHTTWYVEDPLKLLKVEEKKRWESWFTLGSPDCILESPDFYYIESEFLALGRL
jgi:ubiquinone/menaquinone biosynthesis C-methylase UbiE